MINDGSEIELDQIKLGCVLSRHSNDRGGDDRTVYLAAKKHAKIAAGVGVSRPCFAFVSVAYGKLAADLQLSGFERFSSRDSSRFAWANFSGERWEWCGRLRAFLR